MIIVSNFNGRHALTVWDNNLNIADKVWNREGFTGLCSLYENSTLPLVAINASSRKVYLIESIKKRSKRVIIDLPDEGTHAIGCLNGKIAITNTKRDKIVFYNENFIPESYFPIAQRKADEHHLNSIYWTNKEFLISAITSVGKEQDQRWHDKRNEGVIYNIQNWIDGNGLPQITLSNLDFPHSVKRIDGRLWYTNAASGKLMSDIDTRVVTDNFLRGFDCDKEKRNFFIGGSGIRLKRNIELNETAKIYKWDSVKNQIKEKILDKSFGEIFDIIYTDERL